MSASLVPMGGRGNAGLGGLVVTYFTNGEDELALLSWPVQPTALAPAIPRPTYTAAEREVLAFVLDGATNAAIADARGTSLRTVANQIASLLRKSDASSRLELFALHVRG